MVFKKLILKPSWLRFITIFLFWTNLKDIFCFRKIKSNVFLGAFERARRHHGCQLWTHHLVAPKALSYTLPWDAGAAQPPSASPVGSTLDCYCGAAGGMRNWRRKRGPPFERVPVSSWLLWAALSNTFASWRKQFFPAAAAEASLQFFNTWKPDSLLSRARQLHQLSLLPWSDVQLQKALLLHF